MDPAPASVTQWTFLLTQLNRLVDTGESVSVADVSREIQAGSIFDWLRSALPFPKLDLCFYQPGATVYPSDVMVDFLQRLDGVSTFGVAHNGLSLLIAYGGGASSEGH